MPEITKILAALPSEPQEYHRQQLQQAAPKAQITYKSRWEATEEDVRGIEVLIGNIPRKIVAQAEALQWIQLSSSGTEPYSKPGALREGIRLTSATGVFGPIIAEHMLGILLMLMRNLHLYRDNQHQSLWQGMGRFSVLYRSTVLVVGMGDLGGEFAKRVHALGARVLGVRRRAGEKPDYVDEMYSLDELDRLLPQADVVALHLPSTPETTGMFGREKLALMKQGAFLLNAGRGDALDTGALVEALDSGHLAGAGVDVTDPEPLPQDHALWRCKNAVITPHLAGGWSFQVETLDRIVDLAADNLRRYRAGEPLRNLVNMSTGYIA